jgi:hypothetical protein
MKEATMQANTNSPVQFGAGGEHWWQIPVGAALVTSDGISAGTVQELGTAYLHARAILDPSEPEALHDLYVPLQAIYSFDAQLNVAHLNTPWAGVSQMVTAPPATDPLSLQASQLGAVPAAAANPPVTVREYAIPLREQYVVVTPLPMVTKEVTVRRDVTSGQILVTESVRREDASVIVESNDDPEAPTQSLKL